MFAMGRKQTLGQWQLWVESGYSRRALLRSYLPIMPNIMTTDEALRFISACADSGVAISSVDGFHATAEGYAEDVDLMFTAVAGDAPMETASAATRFIHDNDAPDVVWEIWSADMEVPPSA
jgi:hypothetical protein